MTDLIIRTPYAFRDERLFPAGWRSFSTLIWGINHLEVTKEIIGIGGLEPASTNEIQCLHILVAEDPNFEYVGINDLSFNVVDVIARFDLNISNEFLGLNHFEQEKTIEVFSVNSLHHPMVDVIALNVLETSSELISVNAIEVPFEREYSGINYLSAEKLNTIITINDILLTEQVSNELIGMNRLDAPVSYTTSSHIIYIYIDDMLVNRYVDNWEINISSSDYVNSAKIVFADKDIFSNCNPLINMEERRIQIVVDGIVYNFMLEKREPARSTTDNRFSVWGRSLVATLDLPFAVPIIDKEIVYNYNTDEWYNPDDASYVPHIWQTGNVTAKEIMQSVIGDFSLDFRINDFIVKKGSFSVPHGSPITIVNNLAKVVGAHVRTDLTDRIVVKYWQFNTDGNSVVTFTDLDNIYMLNEKLAYPSGYNKVLVKGYEDPITESSTNMVLELDNVLNDDKTQFDFGDEIWIRLYKSPFNITYGISCSLGDLYLVIEDNQDIISQESSGFAGKTLSSSHPILTVSSIERYNCESLTISEYSYTSGYSIVTSETEIQDEPVLISYISKYDLYKLIVNRPCEAMTFTEVLSQITAKQT